MELVPRLYAPAGVHQQTTDGGGGPDRWGSEAVALTGRSVAELEAVLAQQLAASGWTHLAGRAEGGFAWSTWQVPEEGH